MRYLNVLKQILFLIVITIFIQACSTGKYYGVKTTLHDSFKQQILTAGIAKAEREYLNEAVPIVFLVSQDGQYVSWWRCTTKDCNYNMESSVQRAKRYCESQSLGKQCYIHYIKKKKVNKNIKYKQALTHKVVSAENTVSISSSVSKGKVLYFPDRKSVV